MRAISAAAVTLVALSLIVPASFAARSHVYIDEPFGQVELDGPDTVYPGQRVQYRIFSQVPFDDSHLGKTMTLDIAAPLTDATFSAVAGEPDCTSTGVGQWTCSHKKTVDTWYLRGYAPSEDFSVTADHGEYKTRIDVTVGARADLGVTIEAASPVAAGSAATAKAVITNAGPSKASVAFFAAVTKPDWSTLTPVGSDDASCTTNFFGMPVTACAFELDVRATRTINLSASISAPGDQVFAGFVWPAGPVPIVANGEIFSVTPSDRNLLNNLAIAPFAQLGGGPLLEVSLSNAPLEPLAGETTTVTMTIKNAGNLPASAVRAAVMARGGAAIASTGMDCIGNGLAQTCTLGALAAGASRTASWTVTAGDTPILFEATAETPQADFTGVAPAGTTPWSTSSQLSILTLSPEPANIVWTFGRQTEERGVRQYMILTLTAENTGAGRSGWMTVDISHEGGARMDEVTGAKCIPLDVGYSCTFLTGLGPGESREVRILLDNEAAGPVTLTADPSVGATVTHTYNVVPSKAELSFDRLVVSNPTPRIGETVNIRFVVTNAGPQTATNAYIDAPLPSGLSFPDDSRGPCVKTGSNIRCFLGSIRSGATVNENVDVEAVAVGTYETTGTVVSRVADPLTSNNSASASITITAL